MLFTTGGSDAIEVAVKIARAATGRYKTLSFWDAFHGAGFGAGALSGEALFRSGAGGAAGAGRRARRAVRQLPLPLRHVERRSVGRGLRAHDRVRAGARGRHRRPRRRADPRRALHAAARLLGAACARPATGTARCSIFDEIPTGLGKTGKMFACQHDGVAPDILVLGKALGGGILPIAAVLARPELDVGAEWAFGHYTHEKNPVTARAALTTIEIIEDEGLVGERRPGRRVRARAAATS